MKTADEIYSDMKISFAQRSGRELSDDCDMAVRMYAAAAQIESLYLYNDWVKKQCFPQTAEGEFLDRHAQMRGLSRNPAVNATGTIRFFLNEISEEDITVDAGTVCMTASELYFVTEENAVINAGSLYADAPAYAANAGKDGNVEIGAVAYMSAMPVGISACRNITAFSGGADAENDESLRERVMSSFRRLPNGANKAYYEKETLSVPGVGAVTVIPKNRGVGTVDIIFAAEDGIPTEELVEEVENRLNASREICVDIQVSAPEAVTVNIFAELDVETGYEFSDVKAAVESALNDYFSGRLLSQDITRAKLGSIIYGVEGVRNYSISTPAADISIDEDQLPVIGTVTVSAWS